MKATTLAKVRRALILLCSVALLSACGSNVAQRPAAGSAAPAAVAVYPAGTAPFKNRLEAQRAGVWAGSSAQNCCFLGPKASITLAKPANATVAIFQFYIPDVSTLKAGETLTIKSMGKTVLGSTKTSGGVINVVVPVPPSLQAKSAKVPAEIIAEKWYVPQKLEINNDVRQLSVLLLSVRYK